MDVDSLNNAKALDELLRAMAAFDKLDTSSVEKKLTSTDEYLLNYQEQMTLERKIKRKSKRKVGRPKLHWKERKRREREQRARWYRTRQKPRDIAATLDSVTKGGWYERVRLNWRKHKVPFEITQEEWSTHIAPTLEGRVPYVERINCTLGIRLDNVVVYDRSTREVLYDGTQYTLDTLGYTVS